jgi:hypothetical protein
MLDKNGHELNVGDEVLFEFREGGYPKTFPPSIIPAKIMEIQPTEIKIMFGVQRWRWVPNTQVEYASPEKLFLYELEN